MAEDRSVCVGLASGRIRLCAVRVDKCFYLACPYLKLDGRSTLPTRPGPAKLVRLKSFTTGNLGFDWRFRNVPLDQRWAATLYSLFKIPELARKAQKSTDERKYITVLHVPR